MTSAFGTTPAIPTVSVIVSASGRRGWQGLQEAVESARAQAEATEVIVVVDRSAAGSAAGSAPSSGAESAAASAALLRRAELTWPMLLVVENAGDPGVSGTRNTGLARATGEVVAFLDDESTADADWLTWILDPFADARVAAVGGHVEPMWADSRGAALYPEELLWIVGCSSRGLPEELDDVYSLLGGSMAFRRDAILTAGGFAPAVGRLGSAALGGVEKELCLRIHQADPSARLCYEPLSLVNRQVSVGLGTWRCLLRRSFAAGASTAVLGKTLGRGNALAGEPWRLARLLPGAFARESRRTGSGGGRRALAIALSVVFLAVGYLAGSVAGVAVPRRSWLAAVTPARAAGTGAAAGTAAPVPTPAPRAPRRHPILH